MNYFELHIGDYETATSHLSAIEDGIYGRLLRRYYSTEMPLPLDVAAVQRVARARSREEKKAVEVVLQEFFSLEDDGWRHSRCDEQIDRYRDGEDERQTKRKNERARQKTARERRAQLFEQLRSHGIVPKWDTPTHALEAHLSRMTGRDSSVIGDGQSQAGHAPATATQSPIPINQDIQITSTALTDTSESARRKKPPRELPVHVEAARAMISAGCPATRVNPSHAGLIAACDAGVTPAMLGDTVREAQAKTPPISDPFTWAITTARNRLADANARPSAPKHTAAEDFRGKTYDGTDITRLPAHIRAAVEADIASAGT